ncbi:glutamate 5-kinase [Moraxella catarrhalis]|uniref:glutamate 5-kinase n=1 Tax=Moraxella catarrhalis TaxID=480 RepID=UPI00128CFDEB|nr:glutamate 5-kinase [Moraxella catarrhalis]MPW63663.1 glutamate 5-kinase [Moraxella catarrhalis]
MGLNVEISTDIAQAFDTDLADAVKDFTGRRVILSDDDWAVNDTQVLSTINYSGRGVFTGFYAHEIDNKTIMQQDTKLICLQSELTDTPQINDSINQMKVINISQDPAGICYFIQLRGTNGD